MIAYEGKLGCDSMWCRIHPDIKDRCFGWHCAACDEPTGQYGHYLDGKFTCKDE